MYYTIHYFLGDTIMADKKIVFSGIQPTGRITIGNYLGALINWPAMQDKYDCIYSVVDMHSITVSQNPAELRRNTIDLVALYLACGLDADKSTVFLQSHVPAHAELCWALDCYSYIGELSRMTQFKDKSAKHSDNLNMGLMNYPVLMAADILLYQTDLVPVGKDQMQHLELARDIAERFNNRYSPTFVVPEGYISKTGAKINSLADGVSKMSKSDPNENSYIAMTDDEATIRRKVKRAVTDSEGTILYDPANKPAVSNLLTIYSMFSGTDIDSAVASFGGLGYAELKSAVADAVVAGLAPIQSEQKRILADKAYIEHTLKTGAERANYMANKTLSKVYKKIGFVPKFR